MGGANRGPPRDRPAHGSCCHPECHRSDADRRDRLSLMSDPGQALLRGLANEVRVPGPGDLLMRLREHFAHKTTARPPLFPD
jgi:hypothetical protein